MNSFFRLNLRAVLVLAAVALSLAGCGRRGPLEPPPGAPVSNAPLTGVPDDDRAPRNFAISPQQSKSGFVDANPSILQGEAQATPATPIPPPSREKPPSKPFVLDPLL